LRRRAYDSHRRPSTATALVGSAALLLSGCGTFGLENAVTDTDTGADDAIFIQALTPNFGPVEGGTSVNITGWGFGGDPVVTWGTTLADVQASSDTLIVVSTPAAAAAGAVDVTVSSQAGSYTLDDAYTFTGGGPGGGGDGGGDDTDPPADDSGDGGGDGGGGDTSPPAVEGTVGLVQINYQYNACTDCFIPPLEAEIANASAAFFEPVEGVDFLDHFPAIGTCTTSIYAPDRGLDYRDAGGIVYLRSGSRLINLYQSVDGAKITYEASTDDTTMSASDIAHSAAYDVSTSGGDLGTLEIPDGAYTAQFFDSLSPEITTLPFAYSLSRNQPTSWTWSPSGGSGGRMLLFYEFYNSQGSYTGYSICQGNDVGTFSAPSSAVIGGAGSYVMITLMRVDLGSVEVPDGGGELFYMSTAAVQGSARVQ
jgi:hypothetical protein